MDKPINDSINIIQNSVGNKLMHKQFIVQLKYLTLFYLKMYLNLNVNQLNLNRSIIYGLFHAKVTSVTLLEVFDDSNLSSI